MKTVVEVIPENITKLLNRYRKMFFYGNVMNRPEFKEMMDDSQRKQFERLLEWAGDAQTQLFIMEMNMQRGEEE